MIARLKSNVPLAQEDVGALEQILRSEMDSKEDCEAEPEAKPLGESVREIAGPDMKAAKKALSSNLLAGGSGL